jgi:hypothetical protein
MPAVTERIPEIVKRIRIARIDRRDEDFELVLEDRVVGEVFWDDEHTWEDCEAPAGYVTPLGWVLRYRGSDTPEVEAVPVSDLDTPWQNQSSPEPTRVAALARSVVMVAARVAHYE